MIVTLADIRAALRRIAVTPCPVSIPHSAITRAG
jgi:hypothetical protein